MAFSPIPEILEELKAGKVIVLTDDEHRENEGDFVCAAEFATPEVINFMLHVGRGVLCVALEGQICDALKLAPMTEDNTAQLGTAFTITVDCVADLGVTTGVSASDRSITVKQLAKEDAVPDDFDRPGHINPLRAADGGVLARVGQTEGSVDLCRLANLRPAAAIIEIMNENGDMARVPDLEVLIKKYDLKMCSVADVAAYRRSLEG